MSCIHYLIMSFKDFNLSCIYYLIMSFKDFNYMYSSFLIQRCHLYYFSSSQTRANAQTYARSLAHSLTDARTRARARTHIRSTLSRCLFTDPDRLENRFLWPFPTVTDMFPIEWLEYFPSKRPCKRSPIQT